MKIEFDNFSEYTRLSMSSSVLLNNIDHKNLRVATIYSAEYGCAVNQVLTFPTEFGDIQREYPILFYKDPETGALQSVALLGLDKDENLFFNEGRWQASYVPAVIERGPFSVVVAAKDVNGKTHSDPLIYIDMDDARVNHEDGRAVFLEHGGNSAYLEKVTTVLRTLYAGVNASEKMFAAFEEANLIEPIRLELKLSDTEQYNISEYYSISADRLASLDGDVLEKLNKSGLLMIAFLVVSSMANISKLIEKKNAKRLA